MRKDFVDKTLTVNDPLSCTLPIPLSSETDVAFEDTQMSVTAPPFADNVSWVAMSVAVGAGAVPTTTTEAPTVAVPAALESDNLKFFEAVMLCVCDPLRGTLPIPLSIAAEKEFEVAHTRVALPPPAGSVSGVATNVPDGS